jgi:murein L,D-transpeptidase YcbB/YkuD
MVVRRPLSSALILLILALGPTVAWATLDAPVPGTAPPPASDAPLTAPAATPSPTAPATSDTTAPPPAPALPATPLERLLVGDGDLRLGGRLVDRDALIAAYRTHGFRPVWEAAKQEALLKALGLADMQGLDPTDYAIPAVVDKLERDLLLTDAFLRYGSALARGRVTLREADPDWLIQPPPFDGPALLDRALAGDVGDVLGDLAPHDPAYLRLLTALQHYRELAKTQAWSRLTLTLPMGMGATGDEVQQLRHRLAAEGFLKSDEGDSFDDALQEAVRHFQTVRGLTVDGSIGAGTLAALNVSAAARVQQIRLNLERWRSIPRSLPANRVEVNVAAASAALYKNGEPVLAMRAIVGAPGHPSPVLRARIVSVLFNPPWNIPSSIIINEIRPALKKDPNYLAKQGYVYVEHAGGQQLQQPPGPKNALGRLKFEMPNSEDVYLHDTPSHNLFAKARRALSHGCIRLENPRGLASALLAPLPDSEPSAINQAIDAGATRSQLLPHSEPVWLLYWTAFVDVDGTVEFRDDVYGRDHRLMAALTTHEAAERLAPGVRTAAGKT